MAYPGNFRWAFDDVYGAGSDETKEELDSTFSADGFIDGSKVEPEQWNLWRWRMAELLRNASSIAPHTIIANNNDANSGSYSISGLGLAAGAVCQDHTFGVYDTFDNKYIHTLINSDSNIATTTMFEANALGQFAWEGSITTGVPSNARFALPGGGNDVLEDLAIDVSSNRVVSCSSGGSGLYYSLNYAAWTAWSGTSTAGWTCVQCKHDHDGQWIAVRVSGANLIFYSASTVNGTLTSRQTIAYTTAGGNLLHTRHQADDLYPGDPGNPYWMFIDEGGGGATSRSSDGVTWSTFSPTTAGYTLQPESNKSLAYSKWSEVGSTNGRWGLIVPAGTATTGQTFVYSDDNGLNWTEVTDAFTVDSDTAITSVSNFQLECDGHGVWYAQYMVDLNYALYNRFRHFCSTDNGLTWQRLDKGVIHLRSGDADTTDPIRGDVLPSLGSALWYGAGSFHFAQFGYRNSPAGAIRDHFSTLRLDQD